MTTFTKRRTRPVRATKPERKHVWRLLGYVGIAVGFAAIGFAATLAPRSPSASVRFTALAGRPSAIAVTPSALYITDDQAGSVLVVDPRTERVIGHPIVVGAGPVAAVVADGSLIIGHSSGDLTRISLRTRRVTGRVHAAGSITGLASDGTRVWAADLGRRELESIDPRRLRVASRVPGVAAVRVAATAKAVWATTADDAVVRYDVTTHRLRRVHVGPGPIGLVVDRSSAWIAVSEASRVVRINTSSMRVGDRVLVGRGPVNITESRGIVWVTNNDDHTLSGIDVRSRRVVGLPLDVGPDIRGTAGSWFVGTDPSGVVKVNG